LKTVLTLCVVVTLAHTPASSEPYPASSVITSVTFDGSTHQSGAPGTDNWPVTWADDNYQYTSGGDGNGFAGVRRSSLLVSRITGSKDQYQGTDIWTSTLSGSGPVDGKSYGIISIDSVLYMWVSPGSDSQGYLYANLWKSADRGQSWTESGVQFDGIDAFGSGNHGFINPTFLQFGKDYQGARDGFVYIYANELKNTNGLRVQFPGEVSLVRVPKTQITDRNAYEFFAGLDDNSQPTWSLDIQNRSPVFQNPDGVGWNLSVSYNIPLGRYLLITEHSETFNSNIGIFDAATPWGPWTTVLYEKWSVPGTGAQTHFFWNFSNKWLSSDGKRFVLISTGVGEQDSWNSVEGTFVTDAIGELVAPNTPDDPVSQ
jgi:hypothetical protein